MLVSLTLGGSSLLLHLPYFWPHAHVLLRWGNQTFLMSSLPSNCLQHCIDFATLLCPGQSFLQDIISLTLTEVWTWYISFTAHFEMPQFPPCTLAWGMLSMGDATLSGAVIPNTTHPRIASAASLSTQNLTPGQSRDLPMSRQLPLFSSFLAHLTFSHFNSNTMWMIFM